MIYGNWSTAEEVFKEFEIGQSYNTSEPISDKGKIEILFATYGYGDYDGEAFVLFRRGGEFFTVQGSHCSCSGLEGQWSEVKVTKESLLHEIEKGTLGSSSYDDEEHRFAPNLLKVLEVL
jgi:hypothetical protein